MNAPVNIVHLHTHRFTGELASEFLGKDIPVKTEMTLRHMGEGWYWQTMTTTYPDGQSVSTSGAVRATSANSVQPAP